MATRRRDSIRYLRKPTKKHETKLERRVRRGKRPSYGRALQLAFMKARASKVTAAKEE